MDHFWWFFFFFRSQVGFMIIFFSLLLFQGHADTLQSHWAVISAHTGQSVAPAMTLGCPAMRTTSNYTVARQQHICPQHENP